MNTRTDGRLDGLRIARESHSHGAKALLHNALDGSAPSCMEGGSNLILRIVSKYRNTVRDLDGEQKSRFCRDEPITFLRRRERGVYHMNHFRMDLQHGREINRVLSP